MTYTSYRTRRPSQWRTADDTATDNQVSAIDGLLASRVVPESWIARVAALRAAGLTKAKASEVITLLGPLPWKPRPAAVRVPAQRVPGAESTAPTVPVLPDPGYYALGDRVDPRRYRVDKPKTGRWAGVTFLSYMSSYGHWERIMDRTQRDVIFAAIMVDQHAAEVLFAQVTGCCYKCNTELTDPISVHNSIGPTCAKNYGIIREPAPVILDGEVIDEPVRVVAITQLALPAGPADDAYWDRQIQQREAAEAEAVAKAKADPFDLYECEVCGRGPLPGAPLLVGLRAWIHAGRCERDEVPTASFYR